MTDLSPIAPPEPQAESWEPTPGVAYHPTATKTVNGRVEGVTQAEWDGLHPVATLAERLEALRKAANAKRDELINGGFMFQEHRFQSAASDRENIAGAAQAAQLAAAQGAPISGFLRWADPDQDFAWITAGNALVPMDIQTVLALFTTGVAFKSKLTFTARAVKDLAETAAAADDAAAMDAAEAQLAADWTG